MALETTSPQIFFPCSRKAWSFLLSPPIMPPMLTMSSFNGFFTAACMMVKTSVFKAVGGFDEELKVAFNDIDLCMKVRDKGEKILFTPYAELYHYESKSRGMEDTPEKQLRFSREVNCFRRKWERELLKGDPYYNPNLTLNNTDCSLRKLERNGD